MEQKNQWIKERTDKRYTIEQTGKYVTNISYILTFTRNREYWILKYISKVIRVYIWAFIFWMFKSENAFWVLNNKLFF